MKVYIYKPAGQFPDDWLYAADQGFKSLNADIKYFDDVTTIPYAPDNVVVGYIEETVKYFKINNITYPAPMNIPDALNFPSLLQRKVVRSIPFKDVRAVAAAWQLEEIFIKPADKLKGFTAGVCAIKNLNMLIEIEPTDNALISEPIEMVSEYRCFVQENTLIGMKHYSGSFKYFPDIGKIESMVRMMSVDKATPVCYTLDVAVITENPFKPKGETVLVECNDFWSVTNYGFEHQTYARMLRDRFFQLTGYRKF